MSTIQTVTETLIRLAKQAIHPDTVLVFPDDLFEVQRTPSVILQGPKLTEDRFRRSQSRLFEKNVAELSFEECRFPRLYHLDFDLVVTVDREAELLGFHESVSRFLQLHPEIAITDLTGGAEPEPEKPTATEDVGTDEAKTTSKRRK